MTQDAANAFPYIRFVKRPVEDRTQVAESGKFGWRDVDFAEITRPGHPDTVEREVEPLLIDWQKRADAGLLPAQWLEHLQRQYAAWKEGQEIPEAGTSIRLWPAVSPAQVEQLLSLKIRTVETLAGLDDAALGRVGMGAVELRNRARAWLEAADKTGKTAAKLEALQVQNATLTAQVAEMRTQLQAIAARQVKAAA